MESWQSKLVTFSKERLGQICDSGAHEAAIRLQQYMINSTLMQQSNQR